jgi:hypothetical protein
MMRATHPFAVRMGMIGHGVWRYGRKTNESYFYEIIIVQGGERRRKAEKNL